MKRSHTIISAFLLTMVFLSCSSRSKSHETQRRIEIYNAQYGNQIQQIEVLKQSMIDYMKLAKPPYTESDAEECESILLEYIEAMHQTTTNEDGTGVVKGTIIKLNELNKECGSQLIETLEREKIAVIIISMGHQKGYNTMEEDITWPWRRW